MTNVSLAIRAIMAAKLMILALTCGALLTFSTSVYLGTVRTWRNGCRRHCIDLRQENFRKRLQEKTVNKREFILNRNES